MNLAAVYINQKGATASIAEPGSVRMYQKDGSKWEIAGEIPLEINKEMGLGEYRRALITMVRELEECKVFIAKEVSGQLYYVLEANGFNSYEAEGWPEEYLDSILEAEEQDRVMQEEKSRDRDETPSTVPQETQQPGVYFIDLRKALNSFPQLSSKKILIPFLQKQAFDALEIICDHIPGWFDDNLLVMKMSYIVIKQGANDYYLRITKTQQ